MFKRSAGILLHPTSLPSKYGIGDFGTDACKFIDFLEASGQTLWQILPLGPTGYGDSPYQSLSAFAGNPLLISPDKLLKEELISDLDIKPIPKFDLKKVNFGEVIKYKFSIFRIAFEHFRRNSIYEMNNSFLQFCENEKHWLDDYALFMSVKNYSNGKLWTKWETEISKKQESAVKLYSEKLKDEIEFQKFVQFVFHKQWFELKKYANSKNIKVIGDLPIFVAFDSADVWANRELFEVDDQGNPLFIAGVPPDYFSATGQRWGNPHYKWQVMQQDDYKWWRERIQSLLKMTDIIRIDHFRGFYNYWKIPGDAPTAETGNWVLGPGEKFFSTLEKYFGKSKGATATPKDPSDFGLPIIAEDLGILVPGVYELRDKFNFPGMKILQFAFGTDGEKKFLPHRYPKNCVVYTGSHDNDTTLGWWNSIQNDGTDTKEFFLKYTRSNGTDICWDMIKLAYSSVADIVIIPMQDFLRLDTNSRMNFPGKPNDNWRWRFSWDQIYTGLGIQIKELTELYERPIVSIKH
jgi:4-alpha-glucanotransferase